MEFFALRTPFTDIDITAAGKDRQSIMLFTAIGYVGELTFDPPEARKFINLITMTEPSIEVDEVAITRYGNYSGVLIGEDYRRYHTEDFE